METAGNLKLGTQGFRRGSFRQGATGRGTANGHDPWGRGG